MASLVESIPKTGRLEVDIKVVADVNISAYAARQKVNAFVCAKRDQLHDARRYSDARPG